MSYLRQTQTMMKITVPSKIGIIQNMYLYDSLKSKEKKNDKT